MNTFRYWTRRNCQALRAEFWLGVRELSLDCTSPELGMRMHRFAQHQYMRTLYC